LRDYAAPRLITRIVAQRSATHSFGNWKRICGPTWLSNSLYNTPSRSLLMAALAAAANPVPSSSPHSTGELANAGIHMSSLSVLVLCLLCLACLSKPWMADSAVGGATGTALSCLRRVDSAACAAAA
jgi:hypothetical protein